MKTEQYEGLVSRLDAILSKMPDASTSDPEPDTPFTVHHLDGTKTTHVGPAGNAGCDRVETILGSDDARSLTLRVGARRALEQLLDVVDGWIEGALENHEALGHQGPDCCRTFYPEDIRNMINDAAREVGLTRPVWVEKAGD